MQQREPDSRNEPEADGGTDGAGPPLVQGVARCSASAPFAKLTAVPIPIDEEYTYRGKARFSADELSVVFQIVRVADAAGPNSNLFISSRPTRADHFVTARQVFDYEEPTYGWRDPTLTADGLVLYFFEVATGTFGRATRKSVTERFGPPSLFSIPEPTASGETDLVVAPDDTALYFITLNSRLTRAEHLETAATPLSNGVRFGNVVTYDLSSTDASRPRVALMLSTDERTAYFSSIGDKAWTSTRSDKTATTWSTPVFPAGLPTVGTDRPSWISPDDCRLYLDSDRDPDPRHSFEIFMMERSF